MNFQEIVQKLNTFWGSKGCIIGQPYGVEVGAGTGNPNTFFRVLGPEPYNVAYIEPSRRPNDGRYGESPNRFQHYFQYQVILKPAPKFNQELYIESLIMLGIDPTKHDIRFVEDNWESAPLGAWGLGWEVWCDGMEISQYTYFQQMAGLPMQVPALEITYGLERLAMYIQNVDHYKELKWTDKTYYGDIYTRHEYWQSKHNFETSTIDTIVSLFDIYEKEVQTQIDKNNFWSAYDYLLKMSHDFNLLEARGLVSASDRAARFGIMGRYTKTISKMYLEDREMLGYPLMNKVVPISYKPPIKKLDKNSNTKYQKNVLIVELGFEEIPADYMNTWKSLITHDWFKKQLRENKISFRKAYVYSTPQRIVLKIVSPTKFAYKTEIIAGPPSSIAYKNYAPTEILKQFLIKNGATIKDLKREIKNGKEIVTINRKLKVTLNRIIQNIINEVLALAPKTKWMKWDKETPAFIRPLRWIIGFHNSKKLKLGAFSVTNGNLTKLPRYESPSLCTINSAQDYLSFIQNFGIILSHKKRERRITQLLNKYNETIIGNSQKMILLNALLTENPHVTKIKLDSKYKVLPIELITLILEKNQMYPLSTDKAGNIYYNIVTNQYRVNKNILLGNQKVARARLDDGLFYFQQDSQHSLIDFGKKLENINFHPKIGSYADKKNRIKKLVNKLNLLLKHKTSKILNDALNLIKNDKATALCNEFPQLEGKIGRAYALKEGLNVETAELLNAHYLPLELNSEVPKNLEAKILSLADKLDSLIELSKAEGLPDGGSDTFEIRKTTYRILTLLIAGEINIDLSAVLTDEKLISFINTRFEQYLLDLKIPQWIAHNVALGTSLNYLNKYNFALQLAELTSDSDKKDSITETFKRVQNILEKNKEEAIKSQNYKYTKVAISKEEKNLQDNIDAHKKSTYSPKELLKLQEILQIYFEKTMVMDKDENLRMMRLQYLSILRSIIKEYFAISFT